MNKKMAICSSCKTILDLREIFGGLVHTGQELRRRRAIYPKSGRAAYPDVKKQNEFISKSVFDGKGNYLYHRGLISQRP